MAPRTRTTRSSAAKVKEEPAAKVKKEPAAPTRGAKRKSAAAAEPEPAAPAKRTRTGPAAAKTAAKPKAAPKPNKAAKPNKAPASTKISSNNTKNSTKSRTPTGLKGVAPPTRQQQGSIDAGFFEAAAGKLANAQLVEDARLVHVDPAANTDKYYIVQLIQSGKSFFCWQRWGRTGTAGQGAVHKGTQAKMRAEFTDKFAEKTGVDFEDASSGAAAPLAGHYRWLAVAAAGAGGAASWEYYVDDGVDGKSTGWYPYDEEAGTFVEEVYRDAHVAHNANMQLRFVASGNWTYRVDLTSSKGAFTQTNTSTSKVRRIRRVQGNAVTSAASPAKQAKQSKPAKRATAAAAAPAATPRTPPSKQARARTAAQSSTDDGDDEEDEVDTSTLHATASRMIPGGSVVDGHSATLNQSNIAGGANNNKFYVVQAVRRPNGSFVCFTLWGRIGEPGATKLIECGSSKEHCLHEFDAKFRAKTGNAWAARSSFAKKAGKYDLILTKASPAPGAASSARGAGAAAGGSSSSSSSSSGARAHAPSRLDPETQDFVSFIFSKDMFNSSMAQLNVDTQKLPLGALTRQQVQAAYDALDALDAEITGRQRRNVLEELSGRYYTVMPHNFGRARPPVIASAPALQKEYDLVNVIADVEQAQSIERDAQASAGKQKQEPHPLDSRFDSLNMDDWQPVPQQSPLFRKLEQYAGNSKGYRSVRLQRVFQVGRAGEDTRFRRHDALERTLLWHGTNVAVVAAILKSGLRIMPHSGGRVGAGIYLASEHAKSLGYTQGAQHRGKNLSVMFLVEAALGKPKEITRDDSSLRAAPAGFHSVFARGEQSPLGVKDEVLTIDGRAVRLPLGAPAKTNVKSSFHQDELLIYDESQHRLRFVLVFEG